MNTLYTVSLRRQRDLLVARVRLRQTCKLLGFGPLDQIKIACAAYETACRETARHGSLRLTVDVAGGRLRISLAGLKDNGLATDRPQPLAQFSAPLPGTAVLSAEDLGWVLQQLLLLDRPSLHAELRRHNQDLLYVLSQLPKTSGVTTPEPVAAVPCAA
jgi:hypothetical protein